MKALIFDMGGVLVDLDLDACRNAFKELLGFYEIDQILDPCHQKGIIGDMEAGLVSGDAFRDYVLEHSRSGAERADVDIAFNKILVGIAPYKIDMLRRLAEKYDIYMLSNNNPIATACAEKMFEKAGFPCPDIHENSRKLIFENENLKTKFTNIKTENENLKTKYSSIKEENQNLKNKCSTLKEEHSTIIE